MANTFKNYTGASIGPAGSTVYTVPSSTTAVMIGCNLANRLSTQITASVQLGSTYIVKDAPIPGGSALSVLDGKIIAETTETITATSSDSDSLDVIVSVLEQS